MAKAFMVVPPASMTGVENGAVGGPENRLPKEGDRSNFFSGTLRALRDSRSNHFY
jgi:hypothetical protein